MTMAKFYLVLTAGEEEAFWNLLYVLGLYLAACSLLISLVNYFGTRVGINIRQNLTSELHHEYMNEIVFYKLNQFESGIDNPYVMLPLPPS